MNHERDDWQAGFPFSPSLIRSNAETGAGFRNLAAARINDARIPDAYAINPASEISAPPASRFPTPRLPAPWRVAPAEPLAISARPIAQHPVSRQKGVRLLPLESFVWGSRSTPPQPRTRADHSLIWVISGRMQIDLPRRRDMLTADCVRYLPAGTAFAALPQTETRGHVLLISPQLIGQIDFPQTSLCGCAGSGAPALLATLHELAIEADKPRPGAELPLLLGVLALRLTRLEPMRAASDHPAPPSGNPGSLVRRLLDAAGPKLGQGVTIADLAEELGTTTALLDKACMTARGRRAIDLLHMLRLERAIDRLRHSHLPLQQIACELGYSGHAHFTRACVAATGRPPEAFRNGPYSDESPPA